MKWQRLFFLGGLIAVWGMVHSHSGFALPGSPAQAVLLERLIINEVDYDQPLLDAEEFIEITNIGDTSADLGQYEVWLIDEEGTEYEVIPLPSGSLPPGGYYVLCVNQLAVVNCDHTFTGPIRNSAPNAVALLLNGTVLVDTVSYEGDTAAPYTEGSGVGLVDDGTVVMQGISRWPNGTDTDQNNVDFSPRCATPGLPNVSQDSDCVALFDPVIAVTLTAVPDSVAEPGGTVTLTVRIDNEGLLPVTVESLTDNSPQNLDGEGTCQTGQEIAAAAHYLCQYAVMVEGVDGAEVVRSVTAVAVDQFSNSDEETGQTAVSITERASWELYLPLVIRPIIYGEPNNTCMQAYPLPLNLTQSFLAEDVDDWYQFDLSQSGAMRIYWQNFVPQEGQILLYVGDCNNLVFVANNGETAVNRLLDAGMQAAGHYYIWIISDELPNNTDEYTLRVESP